METIYITAIGSRGIQFQLTISAHDVSGQPSAGLGCHRQTHTPSDIYTQT